MQWKKYILWLSQPKPDEVFKENIENLAQTVKSDGFGAYKTIMEWRIHNVAERALLSPKMSDYFSGYIEGLRMVLKDKKRIEKLYEQFKSKQEKK